jgi:hypothetical protein
MENVNGRKIRKYQKMFVVSTKCKPLKNDWWLCHIDDFEALKKVVINIDDFEALKKVVITELARLFFGKEWCAYSRSKKDKILGAMNHTLAATKMEQLVSISKINFDEIQ